MFFRKSGMLPLNMSFYYNGERLEIVKEFKYQGMFFYNRGVIC